AAIVAIEEIEHRRDDPAGTRSPPQRRRWWEARPEVVGSRWDLVAMPPPSHVIAVTGSSPRCPTKAELGLRYRPGNLSCWSGVGRLQTFDELRSVQIPQQGTREGSRIER